MTCTTCDRPAEARYTNPAANEACADPCHHPHLSDAELAYAEVLAWRWWNSAARRARGVGTPSGRRAAELRAAWQSIVDEQTRRASVRS